MKFKQGMSWKACYDPKRNLYTAETWGRGNRDIYEIDSSIFSRIGIQGMSDSDSYNLIHTGRHLYMAVNDISGPPYTVVLDDDYAELCPWANVKPKGKTFSTELTDMAVELFESEKKNRKQRRKKRNQVDK